MSTIINNLQTAGLPKVGPAKLRIEKLAEVTAQTQTGETYQRLEGEFTVLEYLDGEAANDETVRSRFSLRARALFRFRNLYKGVRGDVPTTSSDVQTLADDLIGREVWGVIKHGLPTADGSVYADLDTKFGDKAFFQTKYNVTE